MVTMVFLECMNPQTVLKKINPLKDVKQSKIIDLKLCSNDFFSINNQVTIKSCIENDKNETVLNGDQIDYLLPPDKYNLFVAGIDINGIFMDFVPKAEALGYEVTVYSDIIKPYTRETIDMLTSKARDKDNQFQFRKS